MQPCRAYGQPDGPIRLAGRHAGGGGGGMHSHTLMRPCLHGLAGRPGGLA